MLRFCIKVWQFLLSTPLCARQGCTDLTLPALWEVRMLRLRRPFKPFKIEKQGLGQPSLLYYLCPEEGSFFPPWTPWKPDV